MSDRFSRIILFCCALAMIGIAASHARAATFNSGSILVTSGNGGTPTDFNTLPYVTPGTSSTDFASSTLTPDATGLVFKATFSQSIANVLGDAYGQFSINFNATGGDTFSLFGSANPTGGVGSLNVSLTEQGVGSIYSYSNSEDGPADITADTTGGATAGVLATGDYTFVISEELDDSDIQSAISGLNPDATSPIDTSAGSGGITLVSTGVVPEPAPGIFLLIVGLTLMLSTRRRRAISN